MDLTNASIDAYRELAMDLTNNVLVHIPKPPDGHYKHKGKHRHIVHKNGFRHQDELGVYHFIDGGIRVECGDHAVIDFLNLRVGKIESLIFHPAEESNRRSEPISLIEWTAGKKRQVYTFTDTERVTETKRYTSKFGLAQELSYSLRTKVGGGIEGIAEGEIESEWSFKTSFTEEFEKEETKETSTEHSQSAKYIVPAMHHTELTREKVTADYHRVVEMTGVLDARIFIHSEYPDWNPNRRDFAFGADSLMLLENYLRGGGEAKNPHTDKFFRERRFSGYASKRDPLHMTVTKSYSYENVQHTAIQQIDTPIEN